MIGERIRSLRKEREWNQGELAKRIDVGRTTITEYERNMINPPYEKLVALSDVFGVSVKYLTGESFSRNDDKEYDITDIGDQLSKMIDKLNDKDSVIKYNGNEVSRASRDIMRDHLVQGLNILKTLEKNK